MTEIIQSFNIYITIYSCEDKILIFLVRFSTVTINPNLINEYCNSQKYLVMTKSNLFLVITLFVLLFVDVLEATEKNLLHRPEDFLQSKNTYKDFVRSPHVTRWRIPPSGPSHKGPSLPVLTKAMWSPSQRLVLGMLPKTVPIPPMGPSRKETSWAPLKTTL